MQNLYLKAKGYWIGFGAKDHVLIRVESDSEKNGRCMISRKSALELVRAVRQVQDGVICGVSMLDWKVDANQEKDNTVYTTVSIYDRADGRGFQIVMSPVQAAEFAYLIERQARLFN